MRYSHLHKLWTTQHIIYPARVVTWFFIDIINFVVFPFIWLTIYGHRTSIAGFSQADIITYYIISAYISVVASSHIAGAVRLDIIRGDLNIHLMRPLPHVLFRSIQEWTYRLVYLFSTTPFLIIWLAFGSTYIVRPSFLNVVFFSIAIILSFAISHLLQLIVGYASFWFGEVTALQQLRSLIEIIFSGQIAPLVFFPLILQHWAAYLPFKYTFYIPVQIFLGKLSVWETSHNLMYAATWTLVLSLITWYIWRRGIRTYEGAGI